MVSKQLEKRIQLFGAWSAIIYVVLLFGGWWPVANFFPLHEPSAGSDEILQIFAEDHVRIRLGMLMIMWAAVFCLPLGAALSQEVRKIEGNGRILTYTLLLALFGNAMLTFYPALWWLIAGFRAETRPEELMYLLNDVGWLQFLGGISLVMPMYIVIAIAAFCDKRENPVFPRWVGYFNLWVFVLLLPDQMLFFFYDGPFAWDGLVAIWIPLVLFTAWFFVVFHCLRKSALRTDNDNG